MTDRTTRRRFIKIGTLATATGSLTGLSGCSLLPSSGGGNGDSELSVVPEGATSVAYADVGEMLADDALEQLLNEMLELASDEFAYEGPTTKEGLLDQARQESDVDPAALQESVLFGKAPDVSGESTPAPSEQYAGTWFTADWSESDLLNAMEQPETEFVESDYAGHTIYESDAELSESALGVLEEGEYVLGEREATRDVIDVWEGDMESVGSDLTDPYSGVRSGLFKAASTLPDENLPEESVGEGGVELSPELLKQVQNGAMSGYHDGEMLGIESRIATENSDAADDLASIIDGALATAENTLESDELSSSLDDISVEQDGAFLSITYEKDVDTISELLAEIVAELKRFAGPGVGGAVQSRTKRRPSFPIPLSL